MTEPPMMLDGSRVLRYALLDERGRGTGRATFASGTPLDGVFGLAIAENLVDGGVYLMHCNDEWATLGAAQFGDAAAAERHFAADNGAVEAQWRDFRALTAEEEAEVASTRAFLQELAREEREG